MLYEAAPIAASEFGRNRCDEFLGALHWKQHAKGSLNHLQHWHGD